MQTDVKSQLNLLKMAKKEVFDDIDHSAFIEHLNNKQLKEYEEIKNKHIKQKKCPFMGP